MWENFIEWIKSVWQWYVDSGLARDTADTIGRCITYVTEQLIPLMWEYIDKIWGAVQ